MKSEIGGVATGFGELRVWEGSKGEVGVTLKGLGPKVHTIFLDEPLLNALIGHLKTAKKKVFPPALKPLCPASAQLLVYLKAHGDITPIKAREELGIEHLPRRIKDLKEHGHDIRTDFKRGFAGKRYGRYVYTAPLERSGDRSDADREFLNGLDGELLGVGPRAWEYE